MTYLVMNIGCIECGCESRIVGVFTEKATADAVAELCDKDYNWRGGGQNAFEVFEMPTLDVIDSEYESVAKALTARATP